VTCAAVPLPPPLPHLTPQVHAVLRALRPGVREEDHQARHVNKLVCVRASSCICLEHVVHRARGGGAGLMDAA
jgi:hypothetical protein